jgi:hypothetical protein
MLPFSALQCMNLLTNWKLPVLMHQIPLLRLKKEITCGRRNHWRILVKNDVKVVLVTLYSLTHSSNMTSNMSIVRELVSILVGLGQLCSVDLSLLLPSWLTASIHLVLHRPWRRFPPTVSVPIQQCSREACLVQPGHMPIQSESSPLQQEGRSLLFGYSPNCCDCVAHTMIPFYIEDAPATFVTL